MSEELNLEDEQRKEPRFPCVGFPLLYSALNDANVKDLGCKLHHAAAVDMSLLGMAFDIKEPLLIGDKLLIQPDNNSEDSKEKILTEVCWCRKLSSGGYRVGLVIVTNISQQKTNKQQVASKIKKIVNRETPAEIVIVCPACKKHSTFLFFDYQPVLEGKGLMPLYDCSSCGTTRSLTGIIS